jgi:hypothetical protein
VLLLGITDAEIGDQKPVVGHLEHSRDIPRLKDRDPADSQTVGARRQPKCVHGCDGRIVKRLRHRVLTEAVPGGRRFIYENGQLRWRLV